MRHLDDRPETFGYSEEEIPNLNLSEWEAVQEVIKHSPETIKAIEQIDQVIKIIDDYKNGLLLATETTDNIKEYYKEIDNGI